MRVGVSVRARVSARVGVRAVRVRVRAAWVRIGVRVCT